MRKSTKIVKRLLALFLVVLMSINTFGAVVGDNDGAAFITKAEFDSLKNNFQAQIDQYNTSIDSKIDGAIASYLGGISLEKSTKYKVENSDWEEILLTNYALKQTWSIPNLNVSFNSSRDDYNQAGSWQQIWWATVALKYQRPAGEFQVRNLVDAGAEPTTSTYPDEVLWVGQSTNLVDSITASKLARAKGNMPPTPSGSANGSNWISGVNLATLYVVYALDFKSGYLSNDNLISKYGGRVYYRSGTLGSNLPDSDTDNIDWINASALLSIELQQRDGEQYQNKHILNWESCNYEQVTDTDWVHTLGNQPNSQDDVLNDANMVKEGSYGALEFSLTSGSSTVDNGNWPPNPIISTSPPEYKMNLKWLPTKQFSNYYSGGYGTTKTDSMQSVGVLNHTYTSDKILQWNKDIKLARDENVKVTKKNILQGALIGYIKHDETFEWEPKITGSYNDGTTDIAISRWRVKLAKAPFTTKDSLANANDVLKSEGQTEDYLVTDTSGKCKFKIVNGTDASVVYCKWWPDDTNICNNYDWQGTLDLTLCGTYTITE